MTDDFSNVYADAERAASYADLEFPGTYYLAYRDLPHGSLFTVKPDGGENPSPFNLTSAIYHISGACSFTFECPHGLTGGCQVNFEQILDIQLTLYEAMMRHEIDKKRHPM